MIKEKLVFEISGTSAECADEARALLERLAPTQPTDRGPYELSRLARILQARMGSNSNIPIIKAVREEYGLTLKDAKDLVCDGIVP